MQDTPEPQTPDQTPEPTLQPDALVACQNCKKQFPEEKIDLHEAYCRRNIKKCQKCDMMVDINELDTHQAEYHTKKKCELCEQLFSPEEFSVHPDKCPRKLVHCQFCENSYSQVQIDLHRQSCGSRTRPCTICQRLIMIRDHAGHQQRCQRRRDQRREERAEISQDRTRNVHRVQENRQRQISQKARERVPSVNKLNVIPKSTKIKPSHMIGPQVIKPFIDPVPISIRMAMKNKQPQQRIPLKSKN